MGLYDCTTCNWVNPASAYGLAEMGAEWAAHVAETHRNADIGKPDQVIQPWQFGHGETKATGLWLKSLPPLVATNVVDGREGRVHKLPPSPDRWKIRSTTYAGIAAAMAEQWGGVAQEVAA